MVRRLREGAPMKVAELPALAAEKSLTPNATCALRPSSTSSNRSAHSYGVWGHPAETSAAT